MELVSCPEEEPGWQMIALVWEPWEGRKFLGTQRHICCLFLPQGWLLLPRYILEDAGQEAPGTVLPADGNLQVLWELLADSSFKDCPGGWGRRLAGNWERTFMILNIRNSSP